MPVASYRSTVLPAAVVVKSTGSLSVTFVQLFILAYWNAVARFVNASDPVFSTLPAKTLNFSGTAWRPFSEFHVLVAELNLVGAGPGAAVKIEFATPTG